MPDLISGPSKRAPRPPKSIAGSINTNMFAGESEALARMGAAIQRGGDQLNNILLRRRYADYATQYGDGTLAFQQHGIDFEMRMARDTDYGTQAQRYDKEANQAIEGILAKTRSQRARKELTTDLAIRRNENELAIWTSARGSLIQKIRADMPGVRTYDAKEYADVFNEDETVEDGIRKKIKDKHLKIVAEHERMGMVTPGTAEAEKRLFAYAVAMENLERDPEITQEVIAGGDVGVLMDEDLAKELTSKDKDEIRTAAVRKSNFRQAEGAQQYTEAVNKAEQAIQDKLYIQKDFTGIIEFIDSQLPPSAIDEREHWFDKADRMAQAEIKGGAESNDPEALMRVHEIEEEVRRGDKTPRTAQAELIAFRPKLTTTTFDRVLAALPGLGTQPEHVKTYFSLLDSWLTAGEGIDDNLLGDDELERAKNFNQYHKEFSEWWEANPDATLEQVDVAFKSIVMAPIVRSKVLTLGNLLRAMVPPPIQAAMLISKKRELSKVKKIKAEFPEAYYEDGKWYVKKDGKRFRVNEDEY